MFNFQSFFQALAMAIAAFVLPLDDVVDSENIYLYDKFKEMFDEWCEAHSDVDVTPLILGFFIDDEIEIEDFDLGEPGPREGDEPDIDDEIARLLDKMNEAAQNCDYPAWYEAAQELKEYQGFEDLYTGRVQVAER